MGMRSQADWDRVICSALVVLKAISICILEHQKTGQEAKVLIKPAHDLMKEG